MLLGRDPFPTAPAAAPGLQRDSGVLACEMKVLWRRRFRPFDFILCLNPGLRSIIAGFYGTETT